MASTLTNVTGSASNVTLLATNSSRKSASIMNDSVFSLHVKCAATATTTSCIVKVGAGGYYEIPFGYTGIIDGIWTGANGFARVTEVT